MAFGADPEPDPAALGGGVVPLAVHLDHSLAVHLDLVLDALAEPEAGRVFSQVRPRLAIFTHVATPDLTHEELIRMTNYDGPLIIGEDLMTFEIGEEITRGVRQSDLRTL